ncbi:unnamed protein product [Anisakis simplex]|uniref:Uncharacterized protein n=1 Tax=Anisakis simplex TaxID=6269 RepID=A0A3P6MYX6_ANISI|nr:unnamed protein product [Anisakis simplex]
MNVDEPKPNWIAECIETLPYKKMQRSKVIRVTLGWENVDLPRSVILKVALRQITCDDEGGYVDEETSRYVNSTFRRECIVYEWFKQHKKLAVPRTLHIRKHSTESTCGVLLMQDLCENTPQRGQIIQALTLQTTKDLLKNLAIIHAKSLLSGEQFQLPTNISPPLIN